jgi:hypothetical protein
MFRLVLDSDKSPKQFACLICEPEDSVPLLESELKDHATIGHQLDGPVFVDAMTGVTPIAYSSKPKKESDG